MKPNLFHKEAIVQCLRSKYKWPLGAVVVSRGKIVGRGYNRVYSTGTTLDGIHAEINALQNTLAWYRKGSTVYVCRMKKSGELALAKPCEKCQHVMKKMGVSRAWYTNEGRWEKMDL